MLSSAGVYPKAELFPTQVSSAAALVDKLLKAFRPSGQRLLCEEEAAFMVGCTEWPKLSVEST